MKLSQSFQTTTRTVADSAVLEDRLKPAVISAFPKVSKCLHEDQAFIVDNALGTLNDLPQEIDNPQLNREILSIVSGIHNLAVEKCCKDCDNSMCDAKRSEED